MRNNGDIGKSLEQLAYEQLKRARQYPASSSLRFLKEKHARELLQEVKRMRAKAREQRVAGIKAPIGLTHRSPVTDDQNIGE